MCSGLRIFASPQRFNDLDRTAARDHLSSPGQEIVAPVSTTPISSAPRVGDPLPSIVLADLDGHAVRLDQYRGQRLLVFMWASW